MNIIVKKVNYFDHEVVITIKEKPVSETSLENIKTHDILIHVELKLIEPYFSVILFEEHYNTYPLILQELYDTTRCHEEDRFLSEWVQKLVFERMIKLEVNSWESL